jgi:hypothetical protein
MTEQEWLDSADLPDMLEHVRDRLSARKLVRLTTVAVRGCWARLDRSAKRDLQNLEAYLEGKVSRDQVLPGYGDDLDDPARQARRIVDWVVACHPRRMPRIAKLFRCVVGNPFRRCAVRPALLAWEGGTIPRLARTIYAGQAWKRLPILADALEEAGAPATMVEHCRAAGPHTRGCWVLDRLLARK